MLVVSLPEKGVAILLSATDAAELTAMCAHWQHVMRRPLSRELQKMAAMGVAAARGQIADGSGQSGPSNPARVDDYLTTAEVARMAKASTRTVRRWIADGHLRASRPSGNGYRIKRKDLDEWITSNGYQQD